mgnify:CR=1 FL=1
MTYKLKNKTDGITGITSEDDVIIRKADNAAIPKDEANTDYQEYLLWVSEGGVTEAAD